MRGLYGDGGFHLVSYVWTYDTKWSWYHMIWYHMIKKLQSVSLYLVINDSDLTFPDHTITPLQQNTLSFITKSKINQIKDFLFGVYVLLPSSRKAGSSLRCLQPGPSHWRPHKSWFERVLTRKEETCQKRGIESGGGNVAARLFKCYVWLSLPIRWQLNFNINMIILK